MKKIFVRQWFGIFPIVRFLYKKKKYYSLFKKKGEIPSELEEYLDVLKRDGILIIPNFITGVDLENMYNNIPSIEDFEKSVEGDESYFLLRSNEISHYKPFFDSKLLKSIIQCYISELAIPIRQSIEWKHKKGFVQSFDRLYHMDTWKHRVKAFLYLHDVEHDNAPLYYLKGSYKGAWRLPMEAQMEADYKVNESGYALNENLSYIVCYLPHEIDKLKDMYGFKEVACTGKAGTLIIFDSRGLHRATELKSSYRKILISYWVQKNHHI